MDNLREVVMDLFGKYENVYIELHAERENIDAEEVTEKDIFPYLEDDLFDKGFSEKEIDEISIHQMSESTFYKLGAYMIALYNQPETLEEWRRTITKDISVELPEEEIIKLWDSYQLIEY